MIKVTLIDDYTAEIDEKKVDWVVVRYFNQISRNKDNEIMVLDYMDRIMERILGSENYANLISYIEERDGYVSTDIITDVSNNVMDAVNEVKKLQSSQ